MGWGSGTANFPYLITPLEAIKAKVRSNRGSVEDVIDDYAYDQATALARRVGQPGVDGACKYAHAQEWYLDHEFRTRHARRNYSTLKTLF